MSFEVQRERVVQELCHHYAHDRLTTDELDARLAAVYQAANEAELNALLSGLPAVVPPTATGTSPVAARPRAVAPARSRLLSIFGSLKKRGEWEPAPHSRLVAVFAEVELDFRHALFGPGTTTVDVSATFADVKILVPPGLHVHCDGNAVLGEFSAKTFGQPPHASGAPSLVITGLSVFSEVKVTMRLPDDEELDALTKSKKRR